MTAGRHACALVATVTAVAGAAAASPAAPTEIPALALPTEASAVTPLPTRWNLHTGPVAVGDLNADGLGEIAQLDYRSFSAAYGRLRGGRPLTIRLSVYLSPLRPGGLPVVAGFRARVGQTLRRGTFGGAVLVPDISGDRIPDIVVSDPFWPGGKRRAGAGVAWVGFGRLDGATVTTPETPGWGYEISGAGRRALLADYVAGGRDVNGDGIGDLLLSAVRAPDGGGRGSAYVVFGKATTTDVDLAQRGDWGYRVAGVGGWEVGLTADMTGDGRAEVLAPTYRANFARRFVIVPGKDSSADGSTRNALLTIRGGSSPYLTDSGDVNNDGFADLVFADEYAGTSPIAVPSRKFPQATAAVLVPAPTPGRVYVVFGRSSHRRVDLDSLRGTDGITVYGASAPDMLDSASIAGDFNSDGHQDLVVHAPRGGRRCSPNGAAYVVFLDAEARTLRLDDPGGRALRIDAARNERRVTQLAAGDMDGDQHSDVLLYAEGGGRSLRTRHGPARIYKVAGRPSLPAAVDHTPPRAKLVLERNRHQSFRSILRRGYVRVAITLSERARVRIRVAVTGPKRRYGNVLTRERSLKEGRTRDVRLFLDRRARRLLRAASADLRKALLKELAAWRRRDRTVGRRAFVYGPDPLPHTILSARADLADETGNRCSAETGIFGSIYLVRHGPLVR